MRLNPSPFDLIQSGKKTIELRLYDEKRQKVQLGDRVTFVRLPQSESEAPQSLEVIVTGLLIYPTFKDLLHDFNVASFGRDMAPDAFLKSMEEVYSVEEQARHAVIGIKIALVR